MKVCPENMDVIREKFKDDANTIRPDDSRVVIAEMQLNAILQMANDKNRIFSQINDSERWDVARCLTFWSDALPACRHRLMGRWGIDITFKSDIVPMVIQEHLSLGHLVGRGRVGEFIDGLKAVAPKQGFMQEEQPRRGLLNRLI